MIKTKLLVIKINQTAIVNKIKLINDYLNKLFMKYKKI